MFIYKESIQNGVKNCAKLFRIRTHISLDINVVVYLL